MHVLTNLVVELTETKAKKSEKASSLRTVLRSLTPKMVTRTTATQTIDSLLVKTTRRVPVRTSRASGRIIGRKSRRY